MSTDRADAIAVAWECVVQAEGADRDQLRALAERMTDVLVAEPMAGVRVMSRTAVDRLVHRLWALAEAAPRGRQGPLKRLAAAAQDELNGLDECWVDDGEDDEDDELPA